MEYVYAALLLHKLGKEINENNINKVITAAGADIDESKLKSLVTSLEGLDIDKELESAVVVPTTKKESEETKKEEPKEEKREAAAEGLSALFG